MAHVDIVISLSCWNGSREERENGRKLKELKACNISMRKYSECVYGMIFKSWANDAKPPTFLIIKAGVFPWVRGHSWGALTWMSGLMSALIRYLQWHWAIIAHLEMNSNQLCRPHQRHKLGEWSYFRCSREILLFSSYCPKDTGLLYCIWQDSSGVLDADMISPCFSLVSCRNGINKSY